MKPRSPSLGIGRKFQKPTVFESHSVADNIRLALAGERTAWSALFGARDQISDAVISTSSWSASACSRLRDRIAGDLSHGQKQWLEIAMLLAQDPKLAIGR